MFDPSPVARHIRVRRQESFGAADFVVFDTTNPGRALGAGSCSALPNYVKVVIPANVAFTVQSVSNGGIEVFNY